MKSENWPKVRLAELLAEPLRNGLTKPKRVRGDGTPMVNMGELFRYDRIRDQPMELVPLTDAERAHSLLEDGDLLFARQSLVAEGTGRCVIVGDSESERTFESHLMRVRLDRDVALPDFYFYFFRSPTGLAAVRSVVTQTGAAGIRGSDLAALRVPVPTLSEQRRIAGVLGALDDRIEHDLRLARNLERIASVHFRHLFPLIEGGEALGDHVEVVKGKSYKSAELTDSTTALVTLKSIRRRGGYAPGGLKPFAGDYKPEQVVKKGEIVVAQTDLTQAADVIGKPAIVPGHTPYDVLVASLDLAIVRPRTDAVSRLFVYYLLGSEPFQQHAYAYSNGSTVLHLSKEAIPSFAFEPPQPDQLVAFDELAKPLFEQIDALESETETLKAISNTLLPKLVSGAVRVPDRYDPDGALGTVAEAAGVVVS